MFFSGFACSVAQNSTNKVTEIGDGSRSTNIYTLEEIRIAERGRVKKERAGRREAIWDHILVKPTYCLFFAR